MKYFLRRSPIAAVAVLAILAGAVVGCSVWMFKSSFELRPVGTTATFAQSADCLVRYANNYKGWELDGHSAYFCFPAQTAAKRRALIACFNKHEHSHPDHKGWPEDNMRGCRWDRVAQGLSLVFGKAVAAPAVPRAGRHFVFTVGVTRSDPGADIVSTLFQTEPKMDVAVTINGEDVTTGPIGFFPDSKIHVNLTIPETAEGKRLMIKMTIAADTPTATKIVTFTIEP